jgi:hypothetical protein
MKKIIYIAALIVSIGFAVIIGIMTRNSFDSLSEDLDYNQYTVWQSPVLLNSEYIFSCIDQTDLIAKVIFTGRREQMYYASLSEAKILEVYKGDRGFNGEIINIYESGYFFSPAQLYRGSFYNLMQEGKEYYVFLLKREYISSYQNTLNYFEYTQYPFEFSILAVENGPAICLNSNETYKYKDIAKYEFFYYDDREYKDVINMKTNIIKKYILSVTLN